MRLSLLNAGRLIIPLKKEGWYVGNFKVIIDEGNNDKLALHNPSHGRFRTPTFNITVSKNEQSEWIVVLK